MSRWDLDFEDTPAKSKVKEVTVVKDTSFNVLKHNGSVKLTNSKNGIRAHIKVQTQDDVRYILIHDGSEDTSPNSWVAFGVVDTLGIHLFKGNQDFSLLAAAITEPQRFIPLGYDFTFEKRCPVTNQILQ